MWCRITGGFMTKKVAQLASVIMLLALCQSPAISQQQSTGRSSVLGGSTASQPSDVIPPDFRGEITYTGTYSGSVKTKADRMRSLSLNEALRSATSSQTLPLSGEYQLTVRYEGNRIYGAFVSRSATGPNGASIDPRGSFVGTRNGTTCTFTSEQIVGGKPAVGYCGRSRWEWMDDDVFNPQGHKVALRIVANQTGMVDFAERERQQAAAAAEQQRVADERARRTAAASTSQNSADERRTQERPAASAQTVKKFAEEGVDIKYFEANSRNFKTSFSEVSDLVILCYAISAYQKSDPQNQFEFPINFDGVALFAIGVISQRHGLSPNDASDYIHANTRRVLEKGSTFAPAQRLKINEFCSRSFPSSK